jgi:glycerol-3-phosphate dehydrogenase (NAD(P)+)
MKKLCILGAGSWGTAQAILLSNNGHNVTLWGRAGDIKPLVKERENKDFLPGIRLPDNIYITEDMQEATAQSAAIILAVPSQALREVCIQLKEYFNKQMYLVNTAKGLEIASGMRLSQVAEDVLGPQIASNYAVLSGPSHAEEVARQMPTAITAAANNRKTAAWVQDVYMSPVFRVYTSSDVAGVELGGALKNVIALGTGIVNGLGFGDNITAALMTRGLAEMTRMGIAMGGDPRTFNGLSGMGDLVVTCCSRHSRNRRAGELIGRGISLEETLKKVGMVVEGVHTVLILNKLANDLKIDMPITRACYNILYNNVPPQKAVEEIMKRPRKNEIEDIACTIDNW